MKHVVSMIAAVAVLLGFAGSAGAEHVGAQRAAADPLCIGAYGSGAARGGRLRMGVDPGIAGSAGSVQLPTVPDNPTRDLAAVRALRPAHRTLVVRLNRLFWSDGEAGIARFRRLAAAYTRAGEDVEVQVRYHPAAGEASHLSAWRSYVRHVVDVLGANPHVIAMTITNEVNITVSPNTSDGGYPDALAALVQGVEAGHSEALRRHRPGLRFGFTYAYRFSPAGDGAMFRYLRTHGGRAFRRALGFVGLDFYPGSFYPPVLAPGDSYRAELAQAAGTVRRCLDPLGGIGAGVPIWITENGVPSGARSDAAQAAALRQLVTAASDYARTFNISDYRWFNLRDATNSTSGSLLGATFATDGLLRADYTRKPSFAAFRRLLLTRG